MMVSALTPAPAVTPITIVTPVAPVVAPAGVAGLTTDVLVGDEETLVAVAGAALEPVGVRLVAATVGGRLRLSRVEVVLRALTGDTVAHEGVAAVLDDHVAVGPRVDTATVLRGPADHQLRRLVVLHVDALLAGVVSGLVVVLRVEQTVGRRVVGVVNTVVTTARVVHVDISVGRRHEGEDHNDGSKLHSSDLYLQ